MIQIFELTPIEEQPGDYDILQKRLAKFFRDELYYPLLAEIGLPKNTVQNAKKDPLIDALFQGRITYAGGGFKGKLNAQISKQLKELGAKFDRKSGSWKLPEQDIPPQVKQTIYAGEVNFARKMGKIDEKLSKILPEELAAKFKCADIFDKQIFRADKNFQENIKKVTVSADLDPKQRARIAEEWQNNMQLYIKDWTEKQIKDLRKKIYEEVTSGIRRENLIPPILKITKTIQGSHDEALNKAKFLAHQETRMLMAKFKEVRYTGAGVHEYIWRCVHRPHDSTPNQHTPGNVRYSHGQLNGKIFRFDDPPVTTAPGEVARKNNPGTDYRCRCFARPILRRK